ncbi:MAG: WG repeat-containing protein [Clostridia bacterium]|nr:WG repeat-containing protein [Clostridia bacterium]
MKITKIILLFIFVSLALSLFSCNNTDNDSNNDANTVSSDSISIDGVNEDNSKGVDESLILTPVRFRAYTGDHPKIDSVRVGEKDLGSVIYFDGDFYAVLDGTAINPTYGYVDENGNYVIPPMFGYAGGFSDNGLARVSIPSLNRGYGYINENGKFIIEPKYRISGDFASNGIALAALNLSEIYYINEKEEKVLDFSGSMGGVIVCGFGTNGLAAGVRDGKIGFINVDGEFVIEPQFDDVCAFSDSGIAPVKFGDKWGFINSSGEFVVEPTIVADRARDDGDYWYFDTTDKDSIYSKDGECIIEPIYDSIYDSMGVFIVGVKDKDYVTVEEWEEIPQRYGLIDMEGNVLCEPKFSWLSFSKNGLAITRYNGRYVYINRKGDIVIDGGFKVACDFDYSGLAYVETDGEKGYIDEEGNFVTNSITALKEKYGRNAFSAYSITAINNGDKWAYINEKGELLCDYIFDVAGEFSRAGMAIALFGDEYVLLNEKCEIIDRSDYVYIEYGYEENKSVSVR